MIAVVGGAKASGFPREIEGSRLAVLLGNSTCRIALMDGLDVVEELVLRHEEVRGESAIIRLRAMCATGAPVASGLCSVVPSREDDVRGLFAAAGLAFPVRVVPAASSVFPSVYRSMDTLGADRYCGVLAARERYGAPAIVVDCGTATTVNVLDGDGVFLGGAIAPGMETALRSLHDRTAQLPALGLSSGVPLVGADTGESMLSGAVHFTRLAVEGMARALKKQLGDDTPLILTGGNAPVFLAAGGVDIRPVHHDPPILFRGVIFHLLLSV